VLSLANLLSNSLNFLQGAAGSVVQSPALAQVLGGQLTNDLTNMGSVANLQQSNTPAGSNQTPDMSGSALLLGQQPNNGQNLMLTNKQ
jgi:hypothetical protein